MHTIAEVGTNVPAFLGKLWKMVEDPITNDLISWSTVSRQYMIFFASLNCKLSRYSVE